MVFINSLMGGGVVAAVLLFIRFLIERNDGKNDLLKEIRDDVRSVSGKVDNVQWKRIDELKQDVKALKKEVYSEGR